MLDLLQSEVAASSCGPAVTEPPPKSPYPAPAALPTQIGPQGIRFDFNLGAHVVFSNRATGKWHVRLRDLDTGNILFESQNQGAFASSAKRYYVRFGVEVFDLDESGAETQVLSHEYNVRNRDVPRVDRTRPFSCPLETLKKAVA